MVAAGLNKFFSYFRLFVWIYKLRFFQFPKKLFSLHLNVEVERNCNYFSTVVAAFSSHQLAFREQIDAFENEDNGANGLFF